MSDLLTAYSGQALEVSLSTHNQAKELFPDLDLVSCYKSADSWLVTHPNRRPRDVKRFMFNWLRRSQNYTLENIESWREREQQLKKEANVGS